MNKKTKNTRSTKRSFLSAAILSGLSMMMTSAQASDYQTIGDLEIYKKAEKGKAVITMMIDVSGSMNESSIANDYKGLANWYDNNNCLHRSQYRLTTEMTDENGEKLGDEYKISYTINHCSNPRNPRVVINADGELVGYTDRMSRVKHALIRLLADGTSLKPENQIGIGIYPATPSEQTLGRVDVPAKPLTAEHRRDLIRYVAKLTPNGFTPIAAAFNEAGAYMMGTTTKPASGSHYSGFDYSASSVKDGDKYKSPFSESETAECDGHGIYFLTDGAPNRAYRPYTAITNSINAAFKTTISLTSPQLPVVDRSWAAWGSESGWPYIGETAKLLRSTSNPSGKEIRTAAVGFGSEYTPANGIEYEDANIGGVTITRIKCDALPTLDARNLCKLGAKGHGFGEGGFLATSDPTALAGNIVDFITSLTTTIPTSPSGTISIPSDPLSATNIQPYAYLPMMQPEPANSLATWKGNLKKYHTLNGTLYGQNKQRLYVKSPNATRENINFAMALNTMAKDLWQTTDYGDNSGLSVGGTLNAMALPSSGNSRTLYVEDGDSLVKVGVQGKSLQGFDKLKNYSLLDMAHILNFLGYGVSTDESTPYSSLSDLQTALDNAPQLSKAHLGGVLHSVPVLASYGGQFDTSTGNISSKENERQDHLIYGSMEGALHMVEARTGSELFSFIPRAMFEDKDQRTALIPDSTHGKEGEPKFGVDAPWSVNAEYEYNDSSMRAKTMYTYGGLRMGGIGFYGLNITDRDNPELAFSINEKTESFERLGQTWSKPLVARIKTGSKLTDHKDVLIFGGGYDMCYENPAFKLGDDTNSDANCKNKDQAQGNAVYMIDAKDGTLLQRWQMNVGAGSLNDGRHHMKHSIVADIVGRDRNNDGYVDHLYFADLGGQVFRIDLIEGVNPVAASNNITRRVVRLFNANEGSSSRLPGNHLPYRFYEKPAVSFYDTTNGRIAMVNVSTGDRSSPAHKRRELNDANRIYGIIDRDVTTIRAMDSRDGALGRLVTRDLDNDDLHAYDTAQLASATPAQRVALTEALRDGSVQGWYYTMTRFENSEKVKNLKGIGSSIVMGNVYYTSVYNPEYDYQNTNSCSARILGGTERQLFCLPWGICTDKSGELLGGSTNGTLGYMKAGQGIQELALSTLTSEEGVSTRRITLISTQTFAEQVTATNNPNAYGGNSGANAMANAENLVNHTSEGANPQSGALGNELGYTVNVRRWYDLAEAEKNQ